MDTTYEPWCSIAVYNSHRYMSSVPPYSSDEYAEHLWVSPTINYRFINFQFHFSSFVVSKSVDTNCTKINLRN